MHRAVPLFALALVATCSLGAGTVRASPWNVSVEGGGEADSNVQRVETGPGLTTHRIGAAVVRIGGKLDHRGRLAGGTYAIAGSALARVVDDLDASTENVVLLTSDLRYLRPLPDRPVSLGVALAAADAEPLTDAIGARTFRNLGGDVLMTFDGGSDRRLTVGLGLRDFAYKENHDFDWSGPAASARLDLALWAPSGGTRSVELAAMIGFEARAYNSTALANACPPGAAPSDSCFAGTSRARHDRSERAAVELTYTGRVVAQLGYQVTLIDSNSFGQSLLRHRTTVSATRGLPLGLYGTAFAILQIDQYLDGLVVKTDLQHSEFTSLEDENRSSLQLRLGKPLSSTWSVEARGAIWRDLGGTMETSFRRASLYLGAVYAR